MYKHCLKSSDKSLQGFVLMQREYEPFFVNRYKSEQYFFLCPLVIFPRRAIIISIYPLSPRWT